MTDDSKKASLTSKADLRVAAIKPATIESTASQAASVTLSDLARNWLAERPVVVPATGIVFSGTAPAPSIESFISNNAVGSDVLRAQYRALDNQITELRQTLDDRATSMPQSGKAHVGKVMMHSSGS